MRRHFTIILADSLWMASLSHALSQLLQIQFLRLSLSKAAHCERAIAEAEILRGWEQVTEAVLSTS